MNQQIAEQSTQLPSLRIAYKNHDRETRRKKRNASKKSGPSKASIPVISEPAVNKEPLPMFDDYKFKAKDHDPL
jgi:hypothetical protein